MWFVHANVLEKSWEWIDHILGSCWLASGRDKTFQRWKKLSMFLHYISGGFASLHITRYLECQEIWNYMNQLIGSIVMQDTGVKIERDVFDGELSFCWVDVLARFIVFVWQLPLRLFCLFAFCFFSLTCPFLCLHSFSFWRCLFCICLFVFCSGGLVSFNAFAAFACVRVLGFLLLCNHRRQQEHEIKRWPQWKQAARKGTQPEDHR